MRMSSAMPPCRNPYACRENQRHCIHRVGVRDQCGRAAALLQLPAIIMRRKFLAIELHAPSEQGRNLPGLTAAGGTACLNSHSGHALI